MFDSLDEGGRLGTDIGPLGKVNQQFYQQFNGQVPFKRGTSKHKKGKKGRKKK